MTPSELGSFSSSVKGIVKCDKNAYREENEDVKLAKLLQAGSMQELAFSSYRYAQTDTQANLDEDGWKAYLMRR